MTPSIITDQALPAVQRAGKTLIVIWRGITRLRLQDEDGRNYIMTYNEYNHLRYGL